MGEMIGMDPDVVRQLAGQLRTQGGSIGHVVAQVDNLVHQIGANWSGPAETEFVASWQRTHRPQLVSAQEAVTGLAQSADNNATEQTKASGATGHAPAGTAGPWGPNGANSPQGRADAASIRQATAKMTGPEVLSWWKGLSTQQRANYLQYAPGVLLGLPGLGAYMQVYRQQPIAQIEEEGSATLTEDIGLVKLDQGASEMVALTKYGGDFATITIGGGLYAGAAKQLGTDGDGTSLGVEEEADGTRTYEFSSPAQAQSVYNEIVGSGRATPEQILQIVKNAGGVTKGSLVSQTVSGTGKVSASAIGGDGIAAAKAEASASAQITYDTKTGMQTDTFTLAGNAASSVDLKGATVDGDVKVAVVQQGALGPVQSVSISGSYNASVLSGSLSHNTSVGQAGSFQVNIPYSATTKSQLDSLITAAGEHNAAGVSSALEALKSQSTMVTQGVVTSGSDSSFDHGSSVASADVTVDTSTSISTSTYIKAFGESEILPFP